MNKRVLAPLAASALCLLFSTNVRSETGYLITPVVTLKNVSSDPGGVWDESYLSPFGSPPRYPTIYAGSLRTPMGEWVLSQIDSACSMQGDCQFVLQLKTNDGKIRTVSEGSSQLGKPITLSLNYKKVFTQEIWEDGKGFMGTYDVKIGK